jgi:hypothetical protein
VLDALVPGAGAHGTPLLRMLAQLTQVGGVTASISFLLVVSRAVRLPFIMHRLLTDISLRTSGRISARAAHISTLRPHRLLALSSLPLLALAHNPPHHHPQHQQTRAMSSADNKQKSDAEWRTVLTPEQFRILRQKGTEARAWNLSERPAE